MNTRNSFASRVADRLNGQLAGTPFTATAVDGRSHAIEVAWTAAPKPTSAIAYADPAGDARRAATDADVTQLVEQVARYWRPAEHLRPEWRQIYTDATAAWKAATSTPTSPHADMDRSMASHINTARRRDYTDEQKAEFAAKREADLKQAHELLATKLRTLSNSDEWKQWLQFSSRFHRYSLNNQLLIMIQSGGEATAVAGYRAWQAMGRQVRKGEKALKVLAPITRRVDALDRNGQPILDADGKPKKRDQLVGMKLASVFGIGATDGDPIPSPPTPKLLAGQSPEGLWDAMASIVTDQGYKLTRGDCNGANGWTDYAAREIRVRDDVSDAQAVKTLAHELGHLLGGHGDTGAFEHRGVKEVEAESTAFLVMNAHGVDSSQYTFDYVAGWAQQAVDADHTVEDVVRQTAERVVATANKILTRTLPQTDLATQAVDALGAQVVPDPATIAPTAARDRTALALQQAPIRHDVALAHAQQPAPAQARAAQAVLF